MGSKWRYTLVKVMPTINPKEVEISAVRSQGAGGQNVNKVATAIHLRFDIRASSLPEGIKGRLLALNDSRITNGRVIIIKSQSHRTQEQNRETVLGSFKEKSSYRRV